MIRLLFSTVRIVAKTILGLLAIVSGTWIAGLGVVLVSQSPPTCQSFAIGVLTAAILCLSHQLGGFLWGLLD
jgi:hypothetical protein